MLLPFPLCSCPQAWRIGPAIERSPLFDEGGLGEGADVGDGFLAVVVVDDEPDVVAVGGAQTVGLGGEEADLGVVEKRRAGPGERARLGVPCRFGVRDFSENVPGFRRSRRCQPTSR